MMKTVTLTYRGQEFEVPEGLEHCFIQAMDGGSSVAEALARAERLAARRLATQRVGT